jgi:hypothetical protein
MTTRNALGQFDPGPFARRRLRTRKDLILAQLAPKVRHEEEHLALVRVAHEWDRPCPLPEVAPGVFANTTEPSFVAALETL